MVTEDGLTETAALQRVGGQAQLDLAARPDAGVHLAAGVYTPAVAPTAAASIGMSPRWIAAAAPADPAVATAMSAVPARPVGIASVFTSLMGGSQAPVGSPMSWVVLAAALGQIGQTRSGTGNTGRAVYPAAAAVAGGLVAGTPVVRTPSVTTGAVTGSAKFVNTAGGTLSYSAPATSTGGGTVSVNTNTGSFSYTPTQAQRQTAGLSTTDTFTVTASNGSRSAFQTITVPVDPGTPVGSATVRTPDVRTGVVAGAAKATDGSGRALTYSAPATSAGGGALSINASTGAFTYTPTQAQRRNAGLSTKDSFTVTISNGVRTITQAVTVPVDPGTPVASSPLVAGTNVTTGVVTGTAAFSDGSGRTLTYTVPATSAGGAAVSYSSGTGAFTYTPTQAQRRSAGLSTRDTFTVTASNGLRSTTQTVIVGVDPGTPVASSPVVGGANVSTGVVTGTAAFSDGSGRALAYTVPATSAGGGAVSYNSGTGAFIYTPTLAQRQSAGPITKDTFTVTANNGARSVTQVVTVGVDPGTPVAGVPLVGAAGGATGVVTGTAKGTDSVGGALTFSVGASSAGGGSVGINSGTGDFTYTPTQAQRQNAGVNTTDSFTVTISNGGRTTTQAVTVQVDPGTPVGSSPSVRTPDVRTGVVTGVARATDSVGGQLTYSAPSTTAGGGALSMNAGTGAFTYTPTQAQRQNAGLSTTDSFTVTISNGARTTTQAVVVPVDPGTPIATSPVVGGANVTTGVVTGATVFSDGSGRALTYTVPATSAGGGAVSYNSGTGAFIYTPTLVQRRSAGPSTKDTFTVTANNGVRSTTQTVTVAVDPGTPAAGTLVVGNPNSTTGAVTGTVTGTDSVGGPVTFSVGASSGGGGSVGINSGTGVFTYVPTRTQRQNAGVNTTDSFTVTISNGGRTTSQVVTVQVDPGKPVNGTPSVRTPDVRTGVVTGIARATDSVGGQLTYSAPPTTAGGGALSINAGTGDFTYTPRQSQRQNAGLSTKDSFTVTISNGARTTTQVVTVPVDPGTPLATSPVVGGANVTTGVVTGATVFSDGSGRALTYTVPATSAGGGAVSYDSGTGAFIYTPTLAQRRVAGLSTTDTFTVTARNGVRSTTQTVTVAVDPGTPIAGTPVVGNPDRTTGLVAGAANFTDTVGRTLTYTAGPTSSGGGAVSVNSGTGAFSYTPTQDQRQIAGQDTTDTFTVTASNGLRTATQTIAVKVDPNAAPVFGSPGLVYGDNGVVTGAATATDADADPVTLTVTAATGGVLNAFNAGTGAFTYTPTLQARHNAAAYIASWAERNAVFTVTARDGRGGVTPYQVAFNITPLNTAPTGSYTFGTPSLVTGQASGTLSYFDADGDALSYGVSVGPGRGSVAFAGNGNFTYTPTPQARHDAALDGADPQTDTFTVSVDDGHGGTVAIPLSVTITPYNQPLADTATVGSPDPHEARMYINVYDPDGDVPTYTVTDVSTDPFRAQTALALRMYGINNSTTFIDSSVNRFTVTPVNGARISTARGVTDGSSAEFSGSSYLSVTGGSPSAIPSGNDQYTIEAWVNPRSYSAAQGIVGWGSYGNTNQVNALRLGLDGRLVNYWSSNDLTTETVVPLDTWTHVAATFDGTTRRMFVNGALVASDTPTGHNVTSVDNLTVGLTSDGELFDGYIDDVRVTKAARYVTDFTPPTMVAPKGTVSVEGGSVVYTPDRGISHAIAEGAPAVTDSFTLTANDVHGSQKTMPVNLTIGPANYASVYSTLSIGAPDAETGQIAGTLTATDPVDGDVRTYSISRGPVNGGTVSIDSATGDFIYTPSNAGRDGSSTAVTGVGLSAGRWGQYQVASVSRRYPGCFQGGALCEVAGFDEAYIDSGWGWRWWDRPTWGSGDYVKLVDTGGNLAGGQPVYSLVQYAGNGTQKQVIASSGHVESLSANGIVYVGAAGYRSYFLSNNVGVPRYVGESYSFLVDTLYPNRSQLDDYVVSTVLLGSGEVLASTDTFVVTATDGHGGSTPTTISVPILP